MYQRKYLMYISGIYLLAITESKPVCFFILMSSRALVADTSVLKEKQETDVQNFITTEQRHKLSA